MTHIRLDIDGDTVMDVDLTTWSAQPPAIADLNLKAANDPWAIPLLQSIARAAGSQCSVHFTVTTGDGWNWKIAATPWP